MTHVENYASQNWEGGWAKLTRWIIEWLQSFWIFLFFIFVPVVHDTSNRVEESVLSQIRYQYIIGDMMLSHIALCCKLLQKAKLWVLIYIFFIILTAFYRVTSKVYIPLPMLCCWEFCFLMKNNTFPWTSMDMLG